MSFFSEASLAMIPSGYKTSKVYSALPITGDGDLTFSRSNDTATRVGPDGLIEKVRTNLQTYSQDFSNAVWVKSAGATLTHSQTDPNGGTTASRLQMPSGTSNYFAASAISGLTNGGQYTHSIYMKSNTGSTQSVRILDGVRGAAGGTLLASVTTSWQRFEVVITTASTSAGLQIDNVAGTYNNDILIAFAQTEVSDFGATSYIATTSAAVSVGPVANVPRLDYLDSSSPRLLLEPQRTNLLSFSDGLVVGQAFGATLTKNQITSPDGYVNASLLTPSGGAGGITLVTTSLSGNHTISVYLKGTVAGQKVRAFGDIEGEIAVFTLTTEWARYTATFNSIDATGQSIYLLVGSYFTPPESNPFYIYGAQLEAGAYVTSYIPTLGAAVTRGAENCSKSSITSLIGQTEGTIYAEIVRTQSTANDAFWINISDNTENNWIFLGSEGTYGRSYVRASNTVAIDQAYALSVGTHKLALAYKSGSIVGYLDGVQIFTSAATFTLGSLTSYNVGASSQTTAAAVNTAGMVNQSLLFKTRLSNADLAALTA
jgi:hypothetical protein